MLKRWKKKRSSSAKITFELGTLTSHQRPSIKCRVDSAFIWPSYDTNRINPKPFDWPVRRSFLICTISTSPIVSKYSLRLSSVVFHGKPICLFFGGRKLVLDSIQIKSYNLSTYQEQSNRCTSICFQCASFWPSNFPCCRHVFACFRPPNFP